MLGVVKKRALQYNGGMDAETQNSKQVAPALAQDAAGLHNRLKDDEGFQPRANHVAKMLKDGKKCIWRRFSHLLQNIQRPSRDQFNCQAIVGTMKIQWISPKVENNTGSLRHRTLACSCFSCLSGLYAGCLKKDVVGEVKSRVIKVIRKNADAAAPSDAVERPAEVGADGAVNEDADAGSELDAQSVEVKGDHKARAFSPLEEEGDAGEEDAADHANAFEDDRKDGEDDRKDVNLLLVDDSQRSDEEAHGQGKKQAVDAANAPAHGRSIRSRRARRPSTWYDDYELRY